MKTNLTLTIFLSLMSLSLCACPLVRGTGNAVEAVGEGVGDAASGVGNAVGQTGRELSTNPLN